MTKEVDVFKVDEKNEEAQKDFKNLRDREIDDLQRILRLPYGRRFVLRVLSEAGLFRASFTLNSMQTAFNEGKRDNGLWLMRDVDEAEPSAFSQMSREHYSELKSKKKKEEEE